MPRPSPSFGIYTDTGVEDDPGLTTDDAGITALGGDPQSTQPQWAVGADPSFAQAGTFPGAAWANSIVGNLDGVLLAGGQFAAPRGDYQALRRAIQGFTGPSYRPYEAGDFAGAVGGERRVTADYVVDAADRLRIIAVDTTAGDVRIQLPQAGDADIGDRWQVRVLKVTDDDNDVVIDPDNVETIDGLSELRLTIKNQWFDISSDGVSDWLIQPNTLGELTSVDPGARALAAQAAFESGALLGLSAGGMAMWARETFTDASGTASQTGVAIAGSALSNGQLQQIAGATGLVAAGGANAANLVDGSLASFARLDSPSSGGAAQNRGYAGLDLASAKSVRRLRIANGNAGVAGFGATAYDIQSADDAAFSVNVQTIQSIAIGSDADETFDLPTSSPRRHIRALIASGGFVNPNEPYMRELEAFEFVAGAGQWRSNAYPLLFEPALVSIYALVDLGGNALTDLSFQASRDGGASFSSATPVSLGDYQTGQQLLQADIDVSAQPSGTDLTFGVDFAGPVIVINDILAGGF
ncbi:MAG: hypothetical protein AAF360_00060 [Pseudomonadota bacterium]